MTWLALLVLTQVAEATPLLRTFHMPVAGEPLTLRVSGLTPGGPVVVVAGQGVAPSSTCPPGASVCVDIPSARLIARGVAGANGAVELEAALPESLVPGDAIALQAVDLDTGALSFVVQRPVVAPPPVFGVWDDGAGLLEIDVQGTRSAGRVTAFADYDLAAQWAYETWPSPSTWSYWGRLDWAYAAGSWWICRSTPSSDELVVRRAGPLDRSDPSTVGCRGGPWTRLTEAPPDVEGTWRVGGGAVRIDALAITRGAATWDVTRYSDLDGTLVARGGPGSPSPGSWTRVDWTFVGAEPWVCPVTLQARTEWRARTAPAPQPQDLATGCGGGPWIRLVP